MYYTNQRIVTQHTRCVHDWLSDIQTTFNFNLLAYFFHKDIFSSVYFCLVNEALLAKVPTLHGTATCVYTPKADPPKGVSTRLNNVRLTNIVTISQEKQDDIITAEAMEVDLTTNNVTRSTSIVSTLMTSCFYDMVTNVCSSDMFDCVDAP